MMVKQNLSKRSAKTLLLALLVNICLPFFYIPLSAQSVDVETGLSLDLRLYPTSIEVTPVSVTALEGSAVIQFTAKAKYAYEGAVPAIADKDITADPLCVWESSAPSVALVNTVGKVTPVSDLNQGSAGAVIKATYAGMSGTGTLVVTGQAVSPPPSGGGGGGSSGGGSSGGGSSGGVSWPSDDGGDDGGGTTTPPDDGGDDGGGTTTPPDDGGDDGGGTTTPPDDGGDDGGGTTTPPDDGGDTTAPPDDGETTVPPASGEDLQSTGSEDGDTITSPPGGEVLPPSGGDEGDTATPPTSGGSTTGGQTTPEEYVPAENQYAPDDSYLPMDYSLSDRQTRSLSDVFSPSELSLAPGEIGVSRAAMMALMAERMNIFDYRKDTLDRCYADLENCTSIFRMFSLYNGINLDPDNLVLFPDLAGLPEEEAINKMALLGLVQGYYGVEQSPFLPDKPILRIETLKVLSTILDMLEQSQPDYQRSDFAYNLLFYREIYAASLMAKLEQQQVALLDGMVPSHMWLNVRLAHALTDEAWQLIKAQKTPFSDVRPDLYDSHWYYPIVLNKLCSQGLFSCTQNSELIPDKSPAPEEAVGYIDAFNEYIEQNELNLDISGDQDEDGIFNIDENTVYYTNPQIADTDDDTLSDGDEVHVHATDPNLADTDQDGLKDGDEVTVHKTNPTLYDSDGDSFSDGVEIQENSDPLNANSIPADKNGNRVSDAWETRYNLVVADGSQDTDGDGLADVLEYQFATNPNRIDSDMDGYTDSEEILVLQSDPNDPESPGSPEDWPVLINNLQYGQVIGDSVPMIRGVGPASLGNNVVQIQIMLRNEFGSELLLGETVTDAKGGFVFVPDIELKNGTYYLQARSINKGQVKSSELVKIIIDSSLAVASATPEKLEDVPITEDVLLKKLVLSVDSTDGQPVLYGTLSEFGSRVNVTWQSLVVSSALIADTTDGSFSMKAPKLEPGKHVVYIQTVRKSDNAVGKTLKISFDMKLVGEAKGVADEGKGTTVETVTAGVVKFVTEQSWPFWVGLGVIILLIAGALYVFVFGEDAKKN